MSILLSVCISTCITVNIVKEKKFIELSENFSRKCCERVQLDNNITEKCNYNCIKYIAKLYADKD